MATELFLTPRLIGERFEGHSIPLELFKDLAVLEEMIIEVAKSEFLKDHPSRRRSPRGFTDGVSLNLTAIEDGSAVPVIMLVAATSLVPPGHRQYFDRARDAVVSAIGAAEHNQPITAHLPERSLAYFDRLGRSLRDGEIIEFSTPTREGPARLTRETRRKLVLAARNVKELTEEVTVRGSISEVDQGDMTFELQLIDGRKISAPMTAQHLETILEAFTGYKSGTRALMQGIGRLNRNEKLVGFESIGHVSVLDPLDVPARLDELRLLAEGWCEGLGRAPSPAGLDWLSGEFTRAYPEDLPLPFVYPTPEGGIRLEWSLGPQEITVEVDLEEHGAVLHVLDLASDEEREETLRLEEPASWDRLSEQLRQIAGVAS
jgi:hypothetical protein